MSPAVECISKEQQVYLKRLWRSHFRELVDVRATCEKSNKTSVPDGDAVRFVSRLHAFFVAFLQNAIGHGEQQSCMTADGSCTNLIKNADESCLQPFARLALSSVSSSTSSDSAKNNSMIIGLFEGRRIVAIHHEDFLSELNHFELKGRPGTDEFLRSTSFGPFLYHLPTEALASIGCAMALAMTTVWQQQQYNSPCGESNNSSSTTEQHTSSQLDQFLDATQIIIRFAHVKPQIEMMNIKTGLVGKFLAVKGHIVKASTKRLRVATADFTCQKCGAILTHRFEHGRYSVPTKCSAQGCRSKNFSLNRPTARYIDVQNLRLQETQEESTVHAGRTPRQIEVEVTHDLVGVCRPGDIVLVAAKVSAVNAAIAEGKTGKRAQQATIYKLYLQGHSITTMSETGNRRGPDQGSQVTYTNQKLQSIVQLCHADHRYFGLIERRAFPFDLLVRSLCPSIIGHNEVKAGLLLCLLGGTPPSSQLSDRENSIRCNSHILVVGDPGMGKSQMLLAATQLAARSVYVGGNTSSTTGLTVSLTKEEGGETGMEAGALVLADQGICCIDEFDKMAKNHQDGLLEAMEQQQVSIAKAGVVASLPARCSVIAAANPKHGSYDLGKTVAENLNMAKSILSRFDLVFILRDRADSGLDRLVSSNIINLYRNTRMGSGTKQQKLQSSWKGPGGAEGRMSISDRLAWVTDFQKQPLPADLVRDYIAYAREYCKPKLTAEAASVLKEYFMNLRYPEDGRRKGETVPITTRQLEALIRLSQARAKACLREFVLREDALDVVELLSRSVEQVHSDEAGVIDPSRGGAGGKSNRKMKKAFINEIHRIIGVGAECGLDDLRRIAEKVNCGLSEFKTTIENLRGDGILLKKSNNNFQVLS